MNMPRCGVKDKGFRTKTRSKRYAHQGTKWSNKDLTYKISKYPSRFPRSQTDSELKKAFSVWSDVTPLTFTQRRSGPVTIEIRFESGEHGDGGVFDGPGGTLAHATFPSNQGSYVHFDDSEDWTVDGYSGTNLFQVAVHEFGHSLGLAHSDKESSVMAQYHRYQPYFELDEDDIAGIQALYERRRREETPYNPPQIPQSPGDGNCKEETVEKVINNVRFTMKTRNCFWSYFS
ncbi:stromelysin-2 [Halyomorpha halys]|uniref:stromelysin-2 n=1 Tax=Halyomorpha halys TaxID=286706 RepID=UPI0006D50412|nr:stromelysin-2-like [Halyomorpha halys]